MKKRIISYKLKVDSILSNPDAIPPERWNEILQEHLVQIGFFQHERLIHLIVTVTFAILTIMSFVASLVVGMPALLALTLLFVVLLIPYIMHYYNSGTIGVLALDCIVGGLIGGVVLIVKVIRAIWELISIFTGNFWTKSPKVEQ